MSDPFPPMKCAVCTAWALRKLDPDGRRRCIGHSLDPLEVARRDARGQIGRASGEKQRGVPSDKRSAVLSGAMPVEEARRANWRDRPRLKPLPNIDFKPIALDSRERALDFLALFAGRLSAGEDPKVAQAASALARTALAALGFDDPDDDGDEAPRSFSFVDTEGAPVRLRGRDDPPPPPSDDGERGPEVN